MITSKVVLSPQFSVFQTKVNLEVNTQGEGQEGGKTVAAG